MSSWTPRHVLDAAAASQWCPDGAVEVLTDDYRLIRYPDWALDPAFPAAQVTRSRSERTAAELIAEVAGRVRQWGKPGVAWWVSSATLPPDTEAALRAAGGKQIDAVQILARELNGDEAGLPGPGPGPGDVSVELVADERTFRAASMVTVRGWGRKEPTDGVLAREYAEAVTDLAAWSSFRVLASARRLPGRAGRAAAAGPCPRRHAGPGEGARRDIGPDPAPVRVRGLQRGALLLAAGRVTNAWLCPGGGHVVMHP